MDKNKYLPLIVAVFEKLDSKTELTIETKKKKFQEVILKKLSEEEQTNLITKEDFIENCKKEVNQLKTHITNCVELVRSKKLNKHILEINFGLRDQHLINYGNVNLNRKKEIELKTNAVNKDFGKNHLVDIHYIVKTAKNQMCLGNIEFIDSVFETINFFHPQESELHSLDFFNKPSVEKPISKNYSEIFSNNGFVLFEYILANYVKAKGEKGRMSDLIYFYWKMYNQNKTPQYIHRKPTDFFKWFDEKYIETSGQLKTLQYVTTVNREKYYSLALDWFKSLNQ